MRQRKRGFDTVLRCYDSDMAKERCPKEVALRGVYHIEEHFDRYTVTETHITENAAAVKMGRPIGKYVTVCLSPDALLYKDRENAIESHLVALLRHSVPSTAKRLLVVGLGNRRLTVDSIGPQVAEAVTATSVLRATEAAHLLKGIRQISVLSPNVFGETGMEAAGLVKAAVSLTEADAVIAIDAMASATPQHLLRAIELTDTGTVPGAGIGNRRTPLSLQTVGVPVTAIGVPTMMRAQAHLRRALRDFGVEAGKADDYARQKDASLLLVPHGLDEGTVCLSHLIARSINTAFGLGPEA